MTDQEAREAIMRAFYEQYLQQGLHVIVMTGQVAAAIGLDAIQMRRCLDYLAAKGLIRPMTLAGGYSPTVALVDAIEQEQGRGRSATA